MYTAEVYDNKRSSIVYSLKQLKSKSALLPANNLEDSETLASYGDGTAAAGSRSAIIIYTSGSTGTPKGKFELLYGFRKGRLLRPNTPPISRHFKDIGLKIINNCFFFFAFKYESFYGNCLVPE
jgi:hypothetical protein